MSKNQSLSQNWSKYSSHHEFDIDQGSILVGNNQPVGSATISQTQYGIHYPNAQSAIDDSVSLGIMAVNSIIITDDGISPAGNSQTDEYKFAGTVTAEGKNPGDTVIFDFYGFPAEVVIGETGEEVAGKVKTQLDIAMGRNHVFNSVGFGSTQDILQIKYNDYQNHQIDDKIQFGIKINRTLVSPAKPGYGTWFRIGTQTITLDGATAPTILYYFKRTS